MTRLNDLVHGKFFKAEDLTEPKVLTIKSIGVRNTAREGRPPEMKAIITFEEDTRACSLNNDRKAALEQIFGTNSQTADMLGKKVELYEGKTRYQGQIVPSVAIRRAPETGKPLFKSDVPKTPDDLQAVIAAWPRLPVNVREAIACLVKGV